MNILIEQGSDRMLFTNVTHIAETTKPSLFGDGNRQVVHLYNGAEVLMGGDDIDPMVTKVTVMPYTEKE